MRAPQPTSCEGCGTTRRPFPKTLKPDERCIGCRPVRAVPDIPQSKNTGPRPQVVHTRQVRQNALHRHSPPRIALQGMSRIEGSLEAVRPEHLAPAGQTAHGLRANVSSPNGGAGDRTRTARVGQGILSPLRLPIPPRPLAKNLYCNPVKSPGKGDWRLPKRPEDRQPHPAIPSRLAAMDGPTPASQKTRAKRLERGSLMPSRFNSRIFFDPVLPPLHHAECGATASSWRSWAVHRGS